MTTTTDLARRITNLFVDHFLENDDNLGLAVHTDDQWDALAGAAPLASYHRLGCWPIIVEPGRWPNPSVLNICPDRLARATAHLDDTDLIDYFRALHYVIDVAFANPDSRLDEAAKVAAAEQEVAVKASDSLVLMFNVMVHADEHALMGDT